MATSTQIIIRKAVKTDYETLMSLYNQFVGEDRYSKHTGDSFNTVLTNSSSRIYVAEKNGILIGFATVSFRRVVRYPKPIAELEEIFVHEEYRKTGIGKLLLNTIIIESQKKGCYRLYIESAHSHKVAHLFYKNNNFTEYGLHFFKNV